MRADGQGERREFPAAASSSSSSSSSSASSSSSSPQPRDAWLPSAQALAALASEAAALASGALCAGCLHGAHEGARCGECGHERHVPADAAATAPAPLRERSEAAWSALGELLIDVIPCVVCVGYWREVGSTIATCKTTWRDRNTWGALKQLGRYGEGEYSRLHWACDAGMEARILELLTEFRFGIEMRDKDGITPLMMACLEGPTAVVRLYIASAEGHVPVVHELLNGCAVVNARDDNNSTPLIWAGQFGYLEVDKLLISHGADINASGAFGTALHVAIDRMLANFEALLRAHGAV